MNPLPQWQPQSEKDFSVEYGLFLNVTIAILISKLTVPLGRSSLRRHRSILFITSSAVYTTLCEYPAHVESAYAKRVDRS